MFDERSRTRVEQLRWEIDSVQRAIDFEYQLVEGRVRALIIFQGILFAALNLVGDEVMMGGNPFDYLTIIGAVTAFVGYLAIWAGIREITRHKRRRSHLAGCIKETWPRYQEVGTKDGSFASDIGLFIYPIVLAAILFGWLAAFHGWVL
ncbi:MAG: hypothetical protein AAFP78_00925 [Pseudomonadota bacterium]